MTVRDLCKKSYGFTLLELMVVTAIIAIIAAIAIPNYIASRDKAFCSEAESDANQVASAVADYYALGYRTDLPKMEDLDLHIANKVSIKGDPNGTISVLVTDRTGRCPLDYQDAHENWDSHYVVTKLIR